MGTAFADPIHDAARNGDLVGVQAELDKGVNAKREGGSTPLHGAAEGGREEIVELLIANGNDVNSRDSTGKSSLHGAALEGHKEIVELLIANGANVNIKDGFRRTPLDAAELVYEWDSTEAKATKKNIVDVIRKHQLIPRLTYSRELSGFSFTAKDAKTYVVEVTQGFKQWGELETIEGTGKQVKFTDPRQPKMPFKRNFYRVKVVE